MTLRLIDVHHRYGGRRALSGISLQVQGGDRYGFVGHNGAGKTTAMRLALGLLPLQRGRILVDGFDALEHPTEARARMGGLIEVPGFHAGLSGVRNLELLGRVAGMERGEARREAGRVLERVGLAADGGRAAGGYSQGMRQRLGIAQALLGRPPVVLLDEPTNGLDPEGIRDMRRLFLELSRDDGVTLLISSHQLNELQGLCNRIGVLRAGELVVESETDALLAAAYVPYRLATDRTEEATRVLRELGLDPVGDGDELLVPLATRRAGEVSRALVEAGLSLRRFAPEPPTLEEILLATAEHRSPAESSESSASLEHGVPAAPSERRARGAPALRVARYELARLFSGWTVPLLLVLPALAGLLAQFGRWRTLARERRMVEAGELFGTTDVTGFEALGVALQSGLPLLALIATGLASQSVAAEFARGTLRNLLLRPVGRARALLGKAMAHLLTAAAGYVLLVGFGLLGASVGFEFGDVNEVLPNGLVYTHLEAGVLWPELRGVLGVGLLPILGAAGLGLLAGTLVRSSAGALALGLGALLAVDLGRGFARPLNLEGWLLTAQLPSPLGDRSPVGAYVDFCRGVSNALQPASHWPGLVSLAWLLPALGLAAWRLSRRSVP